eukprot:GHRR01029026.1.p1 GENE.GHRR01029026.1~~GHRR01029026.1.p1  ORF type:complete len:298 (+),score=125.90 GHRR01029026.1:300-1193(+)
MASTTGSDEAGAAGISEAPAASSSGAPDNSAAPAPALETSAAAATELQAQPPQQAEGERPSSPAPAPDPSINLQAVLRRPFKDVLAEFISSLQLKSSAATAAEQLRYLLHQSDCNHTDVLASPVMPLLVHMIKESPGMPGSASAMKALAILALSPDGRAMLRLEGALHPVTKYLAIPGLPQKHNAGPALQLLQNACCDKLNRHVIAKASGLEVLLDLIKQAPTGWLRQHPQVAAPLAGALTNLLVSDMEGSTLKHRFVKAGGIEATCRVRVARWGDSQLGVRQLGNMQIYSDTLFFT